MKPLPGFRELYPDEFLQRDYILSACRAVALRAGFHEIDGPALEPTELYAKKNDAQAEILKQLYRFEDQGGRDVALRPEMTPTVARMVAARERNYRKPIKWFSIAQFFRYERQQKGRLREFIQFNADLFGEASPAADVELLSLGINILRELGFAPNDVVVKISDRRAWMSFFESQGCEDHAAAILGAVDKLGREPDASLDAKLAPSGLSVARVREFIAAASPDHFAPILADLDARGLGAFVEVDLSIVRGLAYYTGVVFEAFDRRGAMRAIFGGGRYDDLLGGLSDGAVSMPAVGFGLGDVVLGDLIGETPVAAALRDAHVDAGSALDAYLVIADESHRPGALGLAESLRNLGLRVDFSLAAVKVAKQFQAAEAARARTAIVIGSEWPTVRAKVLATRAESELPHTELAAWLKNAQNDAPPEPKS